MPKSVFINAVSANAGGGLNDLVHTLPLLEAQLRDEGWTTRIWVVEQGWQALRQVRFPVDVLELVQISSPVHRAMWEFVRFPRIVRRERPDTVFQFSNFIFRDLPVPQMTVLRSQTFFSTEYACHRRRGLYPELRYRLGRHYSAKTVERADAVFCISGAHRRDIVGSLGERAGDVQVSHLGFSPPDRARVSVRGDRQQGLASLAPRYREQLAPLADESRKIVVNVAHYYSHKNLGDLLEAMLLLESEHPEAALILTAGILNYAGPWDGRTRREHELATELSTRGRLFDLGPVSKDTVWPLLDVADVFAFPSSLESFGHPLLEAMSMQVPVVAADTPIHREITDGCALFHATHDPAALAAGICRALDGGDEIDRLVRTAAQRVTDFSWEKHVDDLCGAILRSPVPDLSTNGHRLRSAR